MYDKKGGENFSETGGRSPHKLSLLNRQNISISGVTKVISFDPVEVLLNTELGMLTIKGSDLHVTRLSIERGEVDIEGKTDSLTYSEKQSFSRAGESILNKLFK